MVAGSRYFTPEPAVDSLICFVCTVNRFHSVLPIAPRLNRLLELISEY